MSVNPLNSLNDITYEILSRIPVESVIQCKRVCTTWRNFFDHIKEGMIFAIGLNNKEKPCFRLYYAENDMIKNNIMEGHTYDNLLTDFHHPPIKNRYRKSRYAKIKDAIVGSCNGLVCFTIPNGALDDPVYICNPLTRESADLPRLAAPISLDGLVVSGFGFDSHIEQYKVVRIYYPDKNLDVGHVEVYTLGGGSGWRNIGEVKYSLCSSPSVLLNGVLHWIDCKAMKIVAFNLKDERFGLLPSPPCLHLDQVTNEAATADYRLKILRGCLCVVHHRRESKCVDIWFYDRFWSLEIKIKNTKKEFTTSKEDYDPFLVTEKNKVLFWYNQSDLYYFDPETSYTKLVIWDSSYLGWKYFTATPHMNTRVSLKTLEKENCVLQEWDGCKEESNEPCLVRRRSTRVVPPDPIILALKVVISLVCIGCGYTGWLK